MALGHVDLAEWICQGKITWSVQCSYLISDFRSIMDHIGKWWILFSFANTQNQQCLRSVKDTRNSLSSCRVYRVPWYCEKVYISTKKCSNNTCIGEHKWHYGLGEMQKSVIAEHVLSNVDHTILFGESQVLSLTQP